MSYNFRYPGPNPFTTEQKKIFYGREADIEGLSRLIGLESLVVLFSKSGLGKSSLLNAGIIPKTIEGSRLLPLSVRFGARQVESRETPLNIACDRLRAHSNLLGRLRPAGDDSLWYHLKSRQVEDKDNRGFLLVFDQFEELFTYPERAVNDFARELSELLFTVIPERYRAVLESKLAAEKEEFSEEELRQLHEPMDVRVVFAIRSDRLSLLNKLKPFLPQVLDNCYELLPLSTEQAEDAILLPAFAEGDFSSPRFDYEDEAVAFLIDFLSEGHTQDIESFQLQILCEHLEKTVVSAQGRTLIRIADLDNPEAILENYYLDKIGRIADEATQLAARRLIEEGLVFEEEERRLSLYEGQILKSYGLSPELLRKLLDTHLIRSEPSMRGGYTYELSHDTLVAPVLKAKTKRLEEERRQREAEEQRRREAELAALRQEAEKERARAREESELRAKAEAAEKTARENARKARRKARQAFTTAVIALVLAVVAGLSYNWARESRADAELARDAAVDARAEAEQSATRYRLEIVNRLKKEAEVFEEAGQVTYALERLDTALIYNPNDTALQQKIKRLRNEQGND